MLLLAGILNIATWHGGGVVLCLNRGTSLPAVPVVSNREWLAVWVGCLMGTFQVDVDYLQQMEDLRGRPEQQQHFSFLCKSKKTNSF